MKEYEQYRTIEVTRNPERFLNKIIESYRSVYNYNMKDPKAKQLVESIEHLEALAKGSISKTEIFEHDGYSEFLKFSKNRRTLIIHLFAGDSASQSQEVKLKDRLREIKRFAEQTNSRISLEELSEKDAQSEFGSSGQYARHLFDLG